METGGRRLETGWPACRASLGADRSGAKIPLLREYRLPITDYRLLNFLHPASFSLINLQGCVIYSHQENKSKSDFSTN
jgi:hypothetical protein